MNRLICPACFARTSRHVGERFGYDVFRCQDTGCRFMWRTPLLGHMRTSPHVPREGEKYRGVWYQADMCEALGIPTFAARFDHDLQVANIRLEAIRAHRTERGGQLLDVGCGNGAFVAAALTHGFNAYGIDLGAPLLDWAQDEHPSLAHRLFVRDVPPQNTPGWDVVTCFDVLEHLVDPFAYLLLIAKATAPRGLLVIETPDPACRAATEQGADWKHVKPREHTMLLSTRTWADAVQAAGFRVVSTSTPIPEKLGLFAERFERGR